MTYLFLALLFAPILFFAVRQKKWYLVLLVAFAAFLPEQLSIKIHDKLPLLSASRILILITAVFYLLQLLKERKLKLPIPVLIFVGINLIISLIHLPSDFDEIKRMFLFIMERGLVMIMLASLISTKEEFDSCVDGLILGCCAVAVMGIVQTVFDYDIAAGLHVIETPSSITLSQRMGLTRAYGTFNAISYGCYSAIMILPIFYRLSTTGKQRYSIAFALNFVALIATFTRSAWLAILGVGALVFFTRPVKFLRAIWPGMILVVVLCFGLTAVQPKFGAALSETGKSTANTILAALPDSWFQDAPVVDPTTATTAPTEETTPGATTNPTESTEPTEETTPAVKQPPQFELSEDFGMNAKAPTYSRTFQWSAVRRMLEDGHFLLGYGYNALAQGQLHFSHVNWGEGWSVAKILDVGFVALFGEGGLLSVLTYVGFLAYLCIQALRKRSRTGAFDYYKMIIFTVLLYVLLNIFAAFANAILNWLVFGLFFAYEKLDKEGLIPDLSAEETPKLRF